MTKCKPVSTPLLPGIKLTNNDSPNLPEETKEIEDVLYYEILGSLIWLQVITLPNPSITLPNPSIMLYS